MFKPNSKLLVIAVVSFKEVFEEEYMLFTGH